MNALVTGGGGFLGRYIVDKLIARGDNVTVLGRSEYPDIRAMGVKTAKADITDGEAVSAACEGADTVFHVAARVGIWGPWREFFDINVIGTRNVIEACRAHGVKKLIFTSSPSVVFDGAPHEGIDETYPYPDRYLAYYPQTKAIAEQDILGANGEGGLLTCSLRPHLVWGPRDTNLIPRLVERAKSGRLRMVGAGGNLIDTVYVENAADAHILAADRLEEGSPVAGSAYFISQGRPEPCWDFINNVLEKLGAPKVTKKVSFGSAYAAGAMMEAIYGLFLIRAEPPMTRFLALQLALPHYFDLTKAKEELGYSPTVSTEEGLRRLAKSFQA